MKKREREREREEESTVLYCSIYLTTDLRVFVYVKKIWEPESEATFCVHVHLAPTTRAVEVSL